MLINRFLKGAKGGADKKEEKPDLKFEPITPEGRYMYMYIYDFIIL